MSAALRLGEIGHIDAQRVLQRARDEIAQVVSYAAPDIQALHAFTPEFRDCGHAARNRGRTAVCQLSRYEKREGSDGRL